MSSQLKEFQATFAKAAAAAVRSLRQDPNIAALGLWKVMPHGRDRRAAIAREIKRRGDLMAPADAIRSVAADLAAGRWNGDIP